MGATKGALVVIHYSLLDLIDGRPYPDAPFILTTILYDVPETIIAAIRSLPGHCVGVRLGEHPERHKGFIQAACDQRDIVVEWMPPPFDAIAR